MIFIEGVDMRAGSVARQTVLICLMLMLTGNGSLGWDLDLTATSTLTYYYFSQAGTAGFFGDFNKDNNLGGDFATANAWLGFQVNNLVSGADAARALLNTTLNAKLIVNPALKMKTKYQLANADVAAAPGASLPMSTARCLQWSLEAITPVGLITYGKKPFAFACGLQFSSSNRTEEHLALVTEWGPVYMGFGVYPWREADRAFLAADERVFWNSYDKSNVAFRDLFGYVNCEVGPLETGFGAIITSYRFGPEGRILAASRQEASTLDVQSTEGWVFLKYFNGRFFLNAEADWYYRTARWQGSLTGQFLTPDGVIADNTDGSGSVFRPQYTESWRYMIESGIVLGPWKATFLYAFIPGPDRRHGVLIDRQPVVIDLYRPDSDLVLNTADRSNSGVFTPYSSILSGAYGAGVDALGFASDTVDTGYMIDVSVLAARIDYALASNLNLFASVLSAQRVSHGYGWGFISLAQSGGSNVVQYGIPRNFIEPTPSIPDRDLGWEVNAGLNWQLLDSWTLDITAGYWQPGRWFNYACIDKSVWNWQTPTSANSWGVNPDRRIDPILAITCTLSMDL